MEKKILSALLCDRSAYDRLRNAIVADSMSDKGMMLYKEVDRFYSNDPAAREIDKEVIISRMQRLYPKHGDMFADFITALTPVSVPNIADEFLAMRKLALTDAITQALLSGDVDKADRIVGEYNELKNAGELSGCGTKEVLCGATVDTLFDVFDSKNLVPIFPKALGDKLGGGAPKGSHILIFGVPEMGKTLTAVNLMCGTANAGYKTLYIGNEDPLKLVAIRVISRFTGMPRAQVEADKQGAYELALSRGYDNLIMAALAPGSIADVAALVEEHAPDIVILDQLTNLNDGKKMGKVEKYEHVAYQYRQLCKRTNVVGVSFCQADDDAQGKALLDMGNVYFSNTGIPAQCDVMVGLGGSAEDVRMNKRWLSLPKNKLGGDHSPVPVKINPQLSKMVGV